MQASEFRWCLLPSQPVAMLVVSGLDIQTRKLYYLLIIKIIADRLNCPDFLGQVNQSSNHGFLLRWTHESCLLCTTLGFSTFPIVIQVVVGSNPISHPKFQKATLAVVFSSITGAGAGRPASGYTLFLIKRCFSRCQSLSFSASRLSCCFLPFARPMSSLMRPLV